MTTIITTAGRPDDKSDKLAEIAQQELGFPIVKRKKKSVARLQQELGADVFVAGKDRYELFRTGMEKPFFFHPNSAAFRLKRLQNGEFDPLIEAANLQSGDTFLDCTLGLASDSIIASYIIGSEGKCIGIEADPVVAFIVQYGLSNYKSDSDALIMAMSNIKVYHSTALDYLQKQPDASVDVVYMDPMFHIPIEESSNFTSLRHAGVHNELTEQWMSEAYRVSKKRVVVKARFDSPVFEQFKLQRIDRPNTKFHFGFLSK